MRHNKWMLGSIGCLVACAVPGGMGAMWGVLACVTCAGGCFAKWLWEENKFEKAEYKEYLESLEKKGLTDPFSYARAPSL